MSAHARLYLFEDAATYPVLSFCVVTAAGQLQGASSVTSVVPRKQTLREGLYTGLTGETG